MAITRRPSISQNSPEADFIKSVGQHTQDSSEADSLPADYRPGSPQEEFSRHYGDYTSPIMNYAPGSPEADFVESVRQHTPDDTLGAPDAPQDAIDEPGSHDDGFIPFPE